MHGAVERHFRLHRARDDRPDAAASMALQEHRHGFASAVAALAAELISYPILDSPGCAGTNLEVYEVSMTGRLQRLALSDHGEFPNTTMPSDDGRP
jgi:hypothetical protein